MAEKALFLDSTSQSSATYLPYLTQWDRTMECYNESLKKVMNIMVMGDSQRGTGHYMVASKINLGGGERIGQDMIGNKNKTA